jgi:2'-5' RNA ligase
MSVSQPFQHTVDAFVAAHGAFAVRTFVLFSSLLSKNGAVYRPEAEYPLVAT